jgi:L-rhamnose mutarotase
LTLDRKDDPKLIAEYRRYHEKIWPEITRSIKDSGIEALEIHLFGARMFMIMEVNEHFSFEAKRQGRSFRPERAGVGKSDVEVPAIIAPGRNPERKGC